MISILVDFGQKIAIFNFDFKVVTTLVICSIFSSSPPSQPNKAGLDACLTACPSVQKVCLIWTKFGMYVEANECYTTACRMTKSKVKVMEVRNVQKCSTSEFCFLCQYSYNEKTNCESIFFHSAAGVPARTVTLVVVCFLHEVTFTISLFSCIELLNMQKTTLWNWKGIQKTNEFESTVCQIS